MTEVTRILLWDCRTVDAALAYIFNNIVVPLPPEYVVAQRELELMLSQGLN